MVYGVCYCTVPALYWPLVYSVWCMVYGVWCMLLYCTCTILAIARNSSGGGSCSPHDAQWPQLQLMQRAEPRVMSCPTASRSLTSARVKSRLQLPHLRCDSAGGRGGEGSQLTASREVSNPHQGKSITVPQYHSSKVSKYHSITVSQYHRQPPP
jgi:hypothetical protein